MSSSSIMAAIRGKEQEIEECKAEISRLEDLYEKQLEECRKYEEQSQEYQWRINNKQIQRDRVIEHSERSTVALQYSIEIGNIFNQGTWNEQLQKLSEVSVYLQKVCDATKEALVYQKNRLVRLQEDLSVLRVSYQNALAYEARMRAERNQNIG